MNVKNLLPQYTKSTKLEPSQLNLRSLFTVVNILRSRGYEIKKTGNLNDLLIKNISLGDVDYENLLQVFNNTKFRKELLDYINDKSIPTDTNILRIINHQNFYKDSQSFTRTFEWYIGEVMVRFFEGFSFAYGVEVSNAKLNGNNAGDFDTLVVMRNLGLLYFECKTGGFKSEEIEKTVARSILLSDYPHIVQ